MMQLMQHSGVSAKGEPRNVVNRMIPRPLLRDRTQDDRVYYPSACEAAYGVLLFCAEQEAIGQGLR